MTLFLNQTDSLSFSVVNVLFGFSQFNKICSIIYNVFCSQYKQTHTDMSENVIAKPWRLTVDDA